MQLWVLSDLHLESQSHTKAFQPEPPEHDVLVVAGDVWEGDGSRAIATVAALAAGKPAVFVLGNAELSKPQN